MLWGPEKTRKDTATEIYKGACMWKGTRFIEFSGSSWSGKYWEQQPSGNTSAQLSQRQVGIWKSGGRKKKLKAFKKKNRKKRKRLVAQVPNPVETFVSEVLVMAHSFVWNYSSSSFVWSLEGSWLVGSRDELWLLQSWCCCQWLLNHITTVSINHKFMALQCLCCKHPLLLTVLLLSE